MAGETPWYDTIPSYSTPIYIHIHLIYHIQRVCIGALTQLGGSSHHHFPQASLPSTQPSWRICQSRWWRWANQVSWDTTFVAFRRKSPLGFRVLGWVALIQGQKNGESESTNVMEVVSLEILEHGKLQTLKDASILNLKK